MADVGMNADTGGSRYNLWLGIAFVGVAGLVALWLSDTQRGGRNHASASAQAVTAHCAQFIALAKASFGANWKVRLDPRDPLCAEEIQQTWESERIPRETFAEAIRVGPIEPQPAAPVDTVGEPVAASKTSTFCLNMISLARSRYGADWQTKLTPEEAASCQEQIQRTLIR